jgi:hypothetical protein
MYTHDKKTYLRGMLMQPNARFIQTDHLQPLNAELYPFLVSGKATAREREREREIVKRGRGGVERECVRCEHRKER